MMYQRYFASNIARLKFVENEFQMHNQQGVITWIFKYLLIYKEEDRTKELAERG